MAVHKDDANSEIASKAVHKDDGNIYCGHDQNYANSVIISNLGTKDECNANEEKV